MANRRCAYVIVTSLPGREPPRRPTRPRRWWRTARGRHRLGTPGTTPRCGASPHTGRARRGRHYRPSPWATRLTELAHPARYTGLLVLAGMLATSMWYSVAGATAFAQIIHP